MNNMITENTNIADNALKIFIQPPDSNILVMKDKKTFSKKDIMSQHALDKTNGVLLAR